MEGLMSMAFQILFPTGATMLKQPRIHQVDMHEYALHLIHYHDNIFGKHSCLHYYIYNLIMRHHIHSSASIIVKQNIEDALPP